jgi:signal transduction histidine kinase
MPAPHRSTVALVAAALLVTLATLTPFAPAASLALCVPVLLAAAEGRRHFAMASGAYGALMVGIVATVDRWATTPAGPYAWLVAAVAILGSTAVAWHIAARARPAPATPAALATDDATPADAGHDEAPRAAGEMNRLLLSLLAHDLRSPLVLADQGLQYVEESVSGGYPIDRSLVADLRARLQRSLRAIGLVLTLARSEADDDAPVEAEPVALGDTIGAEIVSFRYEAEARGKWLVAELGELPDRPFLVDTLVLRQGIAIAIDNAIRYADAGPIRVRAWLTDAALEVRVEDSGPGLGSTEADPSRAHGSGLGLRLCSALLSRAGGSLDVERDSPAGTVIALRIPVAPARSQSPRAAREAALA